MDPISKQKLQKNFTYLLDNLLPSEDIMGSLFETGILSEDNRERITAEKTTRGKISRLLRILLTKPDGYEPLKKSLRKDHNFILQKLESTEIDYQTLEEDKKKTIKTVKECLLKSYEDDEDGEWVSLDDILEDLKDQYSRTGELFSIAQELVEDVIKETFPNTRRKRKKRSKKISYERLRSKDQVDDQENRTADPEEVHQIAGQARKKKEGKIIEDLDVEEMCSILSLQFEKYKLDMELLEIFKKEKISGMAFADITKDDLKYMFPNLPYGEMKTIIKIKNNLLKEEQTPMSDGNYRATGGTSLEAEPLLDESAAAWSHSDGPMRENFRHFDTIVKSTDVYRRHAVIQTSNLKPSNLIEPVHRFVNQLDKGEVASRIALEAIHFIAACLNDRTNGTIHFGIEERSLGDRFEGEIIGLQAKQGNVNNALYRALREHFYPDDFEIVCKCIRSPQFIKVTGSEHLYVVEIDVIPHFQLVQDNAFWVKSDKIRLYSFDLDNKGPMELRAERIRDFMNAKQKLTLHRKEQEARPRNVSPRKDLRQKFLNLFSAGDERLTGDIYPVLLLSPISSTMHEEFTDECFEFIHDIDPNVILDFDSRTGDCSMYDFVEKKQEKALKVLTSDHFDKRSVENEKNKESFINLLDDLRSTTLKPWVFCNGYEPLNKSPMTIFDWKQMRSEGYKDAIRFYSEEIPTDRGIAIFFLFSKTYDVMLEAAEEILVKFKNNWIIVSESDEIASEWNAELLRRQSVTKKTLADRSVIGIPWTHFNDMIKSVMGTKQHGSCELPSSTGVPCQLREKIKNELCDLKILSRNECDNDEIVKDNIKLGILRAEEEENFFRGCEVSWWNFWFQDDHVLKRSKHESLLSLIKSALEGENNEDDSKVSIVKLYHQPGAGGTTTAKQVLWEMRKEYRCCIINQITHETCDQIVKFRNYEESDGPRPPIVLIDNGDEEQLNLIHARLEERARILSRNGEPFRVFCVLFLCNRRANLGTNMDHNAVQLKHDLTTQELDWFKRKNNHLSERFQDGKGVNPRLLISFNILKENFNTDYIARTAREFVLDITIEREKRLLAFSSLMNTYDLDFQPVPISAFDSIMEGFEKTTSKIAYGSVTDARQDIRKHIHEKETEHKQRKPQKHPWETRLSSSLLVLLNRSARMDLGSSLNVLSIIHNLFAREIFNYILKEENKTLSQMMNDFLKSDIFLSQNRSLNRLKKIVNDILKKRVIQESGRRDLFSPLILDIMRNEDEDRAAMVFEKGFEITEDAMVAQQISRFYIHCKNWDKAEKYAKKGILKKPDNSYLRDTYGQVFKQRLTEKYLECSKDKITLSDCEMREIIRLGLEGMQKFRNEQTVSERERTYKTNDAGYYGEVRVVIVLLDLMNFWPPAAKDQMQFHKFLVDENYVPKELECLDDDIITLLKEFQRRTESLLRIIEEKNAQLKNDYSNVWINTFKPDRPIMTIRENLDYYFGEEENNIPTDLSENDQAEFRRRRVRRLGGRFWSTIFGLRDHDKTLNDIFQLMMENVGSGFATSFDFLTLLNVTFASYIGHSGKINVSFSDILDWSKKLHELTKNSPKERPYLESYMYFVMLHWPTESRKKYAKLLSPLQQIQEAIKEWKLAFNKNHPQQRDESNPYRRRETTYFFLGKEEGIGEIVHFTELHDRNGSKIPRGDMYWQTPEVKSRLQRLKGTLTNEGLEINVQIKTPMGNTSILPIQTSFPIGQRYYWNKTVSFYLGFSFWGPKAYDVCMNESEHVEIPSDEQRYKVPPKNEIKSAYDIRHEPKSTFDDVVTHEMYSKNLKQIEKKLERIKKLKSKPERTLQEREEIKMEARLQRKEQDLHKKRQIFLSAEITS